MSLTDISTEITMSAHQVNAKVNSPRVEINAIRLNMEKLFVSCFLLGFRMGVNVDEIINSARRKCALGS